MMNSIHKNAVFELIAFGARGDWLNGLLAGLMALIPEELSVVLLIFLSLGAWEMSKRQVLTWRIPAIETLGSATVLCVDKTGPTFISTWRRRRKCRDTSVNR
ncbi:MAG: hypothetical protein M8353_03795 [ANME-2 cluster archaeon]|nr:hypothetical protein [ANME-2 cluster archaeon]